ncbi:SusC/RagA family protein [Mucilaginibacter hurinus]|uniref:SusC/RagA family protein n=1 Tax=Mucilaginibacter hurinus TaxID=2201324 RepID=A0A367GT29_9SPHI|nr:SusC/RagA family TonB-linked outer membrane protein [Mucilaginibacter hurinus]RCH55863.1 SusC/RagA family protein [Mucilaginibacter hurinus]
MKKNYYRKYGLMCLLLLSAIAGFAQTGSISGRVVDETQQPVPGASVSVEGTTRGAATDNDGNYTITGLADGSYTVRVQFIGYAPATTQVKVAGDQATVNISLTPTSQSLNEVVVIGYGAVRRKDLTGSVATVSSKDFQKGSITSPEQLINGKVAGVQIINDGGAPGANTKIRIRGGASLNSTNEPLVIIDNVPVALTGVAGMGNALSSINPNDIETFTVLKDASATAIYGSRASNGVILITTKKGAVTGPVKVDVNVLGSNANKTGIVNVLNAQEYKYALQTFLKRTEGDMSRLNLLGNESTNWQEQIYRKAEKIDANLAITGGVKGLPYRLSGGYLNEQGILKTSNLRRFTSALNISPKFFDRHLSVDLNLKGTLARTRFANNGAIGSAVAFNPTKSPFVAPYDADKPLSATNTNLGGYYEWVNNSGVPILLAGKNPLSMLNQETNKGEAYRSIGNLQLDYKFHFLPELRANLNVGYDVSKSNGSVILQPTLASAYAVKGSRTIYSQKKQNKLLDFYLNYNNEFKDINSRVDVLAGYSYQDMLRSAPSSFIPGVGVTNVNPDGKTQNTLISYFSRLNYTFMDKYILTGTVRTDGSSRFSPGNKWAFFPSAAAAWDIKQENIFKDSKTVSQFKIRLGYGKTGQQELSESGDYPYLAKYNLSDAASQYPFGDTFYSTLRPDAYDENIKWESTATYNAAIDFGFFDGRIGGTIEYFVKKTNDLLARANPPIFSNFKNLLITNIGNMESKGFELTLNLVPVRSKDFNWDVNFNLTHYNNKITNLTLSGINLPEDRGQAVVSSFNGEALQYHKPGYAPFTYLVYKQLYDAAGKPLEGKYADIDGDGTFDDEKDFYYYKSPNPTMLMGLTSNLNYKNWTFSFTARANLGAYNYNAYAANTGYGAALSFTNFLNNVSSSIKDTRFLNIQKYSDYYVQKASFLRMDNINLGYNFGRIADAFTLGANFNIQNAFVITGYKGLDPEVFNGIDGNFYPRPRIITLGVNLGF